MSDIFISYANEDRSRAQMLAEALGRCGWSTFWDRYIPTGKTWRQTIGQELRTARCVIVLWSKASSESNWVHDEADDAKRRGVLVPVRIESVEPPIGFRSYQTADLSDWNGTEETRAFRKLTLDIGALIGPSPSTKEQSSQAEAQRLDDEPQRIVIERQVDQERNDSNEVRKLVQSLQKERPPLWRTTRVFSIRSALWPSIAVLALVPLAWYVLFHPQV
jgi:hypothetical protein